MNDTSEEIFGILEGAVIIFAGTILGRGLGLIGQILLARILSPERYGDIGLAYTIVSVLSVIAVFGTSDAIPRLIAGDEPNKKKQDFLFSGFLTVLSLGILGFVTILVITPYLSQTFENRALITLLPLFAIYLLLRPIAKVTLAGLRGLELSHETVLTKNIISHLVGIFVFLTMAWFGAEFVGAVVYYVSIQLVISILGLYLLYERLFSEVEWQWVPARDTFHDTLVFSWPLAIAGGFIVLMGSLDVLMIGYFLDSAPVGYYKAIQPLATLVLAILSSFVFLFLPVATKFYKQGNIESLNKTFTSTSKIISLTTFPIVTVFILFPEDVVVAFYNIEYAPASFAFSVLATGMYLRVVVGPNGAMIKAIDRPKIDLLSAALGAVVNVVINILLIPRFGIAGAALATTISYLVYNSVELGFVYQSTGAHPFSVNTVKPILPTFIIAGIIAWIMREIRLNLLMLLLIGGVLSLIQFGLIFATDSLDENDVILLHQLEDKLGIEIPYI